MNKHKVDYAFLNALTIIVVFTILYILVTVYKGLSH